MPDPFILLKPSTERVHLDVGHSIRFRNSLSTCTSVFGVKSNEVGQHLRLECSASLEGDIILAELYCPLGKSTGELRLV